MSFKVETLTSWVNGDVLHKATCEQCRYGQVFAHVEVRDEWMRTHRCASATTA